MTNFSRRPDGPSRRKSQKEMRENVASFLVGVCGDRGDPVWGVGATTITTRRLPCDKHKTSPPVGTGRRIAFGAFMWTRNTPTRLGGCLVPVCQPSNCCCRRAISAGIASLIRFVKKLSRGSITKNMTLFEEVYLTVERRCSDTVRHFIMLLITLSGGTVTFLVSQQEAGPFCTGFSFPAWRVGILAHILSLLAGIWAYYLLTKNIVALLKAITTHDTDLVELEALELRRAIQKLEHSYAPQQWVRRTIYVQAGSFFVAYVLLVGHFFFPLSWGCLS